MNYIPVCLSTLRPNQNFPFNLFVQVNDKQILFIKNGDDIEESRLKRLEQKAVNRIFVAREEFKNYKKYVFEQVEQATENKDIPLEKKCEIVEDAAVNAVEALNATMEEPEAEDSYEMTVEAAKGLRKVVNENPKALKKIYFMHGRNHDLILNHCKNVSALACRFGYIRGFEKKDLDILGAAALLHDIGLNKLKRDEQELFFKKDPARFTPEEKRLYRHHPKDAVQMMKGKKFVNKKVLNLIQKHEEKISGHGYPEKLKALEPLEETLSIVNCYDKKVTVLGMEPQDAYNDFFKTEIGNYDLKLIKKFKEVLVQEGIFRGG